MNNLCVVIEIISSYFPYGLKIISRNTLSAPQPDSASYRQRHLAAVNDNWQSLASESQGPDITNLFLASFLKRAIK